MTGKITLGFLWALLIVGFVYYAGRKNWGATLPLLSAIG